jgi:hypothetical protein
MAGALLVPSKSVMSHFVSARGSLGEFDSDHIFAEAVLTLSACFRSGFTS